MTDFELKSPHTCSGIMLHRFNLKRSAYTPFPAHASAREESFFKVTYFVLTLTEIL